MDEAGSSAWVEFIVRQDAKIDYEVSGGSVWLLARPNGVRLPEHGWKLHVSSRVSNFPELVEKIVPLLTAERCLFKLARSVDVLRELNGGLVAPATVGKAITIYPDQDRIREFGLRLAHALRGHQGPRVLSDRRVLASAPVYYRYGSLSGELGRDAHGRPEIRLRGPDGAEFEGLAGLTYRQPSWATDPFADSASPPASDGRLVGGRYRIVAGLRQAAQGNVYRATDTETGRPVIVKQARAHVAEYGDRNDSRLRLRNERRVLGVLAGVPGVPEFLDHVRHSDDEFLVTTDRGPRNLADDVRRDGPYQPGRGPRGLDALATDLARILLAVHERGVVMRDLTPTNVVVGDETSVIDFGLAAHDGVHLPGSTPGYAPARQLRDEPPRATDDLHALGMTLLFAATGLHPVTVGDDPDLPTTRALQAILRQYGAAPTGVIAAVVHLLGDDESARAAVRRLAAGDAHPPAVVPTRPGVPVVTAEFAAEVTAGLLADLLGRLDRVVDAPDGTVAGRDVSVHTGSAGIGLELLCHRGSNPDVDRWIRELVAFTTRVGARTNRPPGLFGGATGTDLFLMAAADHGLGAADWPGRRLPPSDWDAPAADLIDGLAGVGLGHLWFHLASGDPADLAVAQRCVAAVAAHRPAERESPPGEADAGLGRAHGLAGAVELLAEFAARTGTPEARDLAADRAAHLAERAKSLIAEARDPRAEPMTMSWCRGLAGIGQTLLHASTALGDPDLADVARQAADACLVRVPTANALGQCCGATGVGNFLLDLAVRDGSERYRQAAFDVATHLLLRSGGPPERPGFAAANAGSTRTLSWAHGLTGILGFFRRLGGDEAGHAPIFR